MALKTHVTAKARGRRGITRAMARRIAMLYDGALRFRGAAVKSSREPGMALPYTIGGQDCWIVYPWSIGQPAYVGASYPICVDKATGKVTFAGCVGE